MMIEVQVQDSPGFTASHHMWHQPELMAGVGLTVGGGIRHKLESETAQLPLPP